MPLKVVCALICLMLSAGTAHALPTITRGPVALNGTTLSFPLVLKNDNASISALAVDVLFDSGRFSLVRDGAEVKSVVAGYASVSAGKNLSQSEDSPGFLRLALLDSGNGLAMSSGVVASVYLELLPGKDPAGAAFDVTPTAAFAGDPVIIMASSATSLGDLSGKGYLDIGDASLVLRAAVGATLLSDEQRRNADMNGDGRVDVGDVVMILARVVGL